MKYKILYITYHPHIGGGETILLSLISKLDRRQFQPIVVLPSRGQLFQKLKELKCQTYILPIAGYLIRTFFVPGASLVGIYNFFRLLKKVKPDLIHVNHLNLAVYGGVAAKILKIPMVATAHGPWDCIYFYQDLVNQIFATKILANTPNVAKALTKRKILDNQKVEVVPFGVDTNYFKPARKLPAKQKFGLPKDDLIVTIVGRIDPVKDYLTFFKAAEIILQKFENTKFLVVGSKMGDFSEDKMCSAQLKNFLKRNPTLREKIIFTGFVNNMQAVYSASDILVSTSKSESFGLVLAEAAACEMPIVSTNVGGQSLIVKDGETGFLVPPENPAAIAKKTIQLLQNPKLRDEFGKKGRILIEENFTLSRYVKQVEEVYLQTLQNFKK